MPIDNIEIQPELQEPNPIKSAVIGNCARISLACLSVLGPQLASTSQAEAVTGRPAPSGETCAEKVSFYQRQGALFGKVAVSECRTAPRKKQIMSSLISIEKAGRYFRYNPVGGVAVAVCESELRPKAVGRADSRDKGLFQQHSPYWNGRYFATAAYIRGKSKDSRRIVRLKNNYFNPKSNSFVSIDMLRQGGGPTHWRASMPCWGAKYREVYGDKKKISNWFKLK